MLTVEGLSFAYGARKILQQVSFSCGPGRTLALVGASGSGKTTIARILCNSLPAPRDRVDLDGARPSEAARQHRIGYLPQDGTLLPWRTVRENVSLPFDLVRASGKEIDRAEIRRRVDEAMSVARIGHAAARFPHELSGGMKTRAGLARSIVHRPQFLILDEPFGGLDDVLKDALYGDIQRVTAEIRVATILITHNLAEALLLADEVCVLARRLEEEGASIVHRQAVDLPRPRSMDSLALPQFASAHAALRRALGVGRTTDA